MYRGLRAGLLKTCFTVAGIVFPLRMQGLPCSSGAGGFFCISPRQCPRNFCAKNFLKRLDLLLRWRYKSFSPEKSGISLDGREGQIESVLLCSKPACGKFEVDICRRYQMPKQCLAVPARTWNPHRMVTRGCKVQRGRLVLNLVTLRVPPVITSVITRLGRRMGKSRL